MNTRFIILYKILKLQNQKNFLVNLLGHGLYFDVVKRRVVRYPLLYYKKTIQEYCISQVL